MYRIHALLNSARSRSGILTAISLLAMVLAGAAGHKW